MPSNSTPARGQSQGPGTTPAPFTIRTLSPDTPRDVVTSFYSCAAAINTLIAQVASLQDAVAALSKRPLTSTELAQVQAALSATGANPLNVTGLVGIPTATP